MRELTVQEVTERLKGRVIGADPAAVLRGVAPADQAGPEDVTLVLSARYWEELGDRKVGAVLVPPGKAVQGRPCIEVEDPRRAFDRLLEYFAPEAWLPPPGIDPTAVVAPDADLGPGVRVGARAVIGRRVRLGRECVIYPGAVVADGVAVGDESVVHANAVVLERVRIGRRVLIGPGTVVGSAGFGFATEAGVHRRRPHIGTVVIEDDVEIGANACIDRGSCGATVIGRGTKIDNMVQVAHNVRIGPNCLIIGQVGIAGSARIGAGVILAGQVGVKDHVTIGDSAVVAARTMVIQDVPAGAKVAGEPAMPHAHALRVWAVSRRLPEMLERLEHLEERLRSLEKGG